MQYRTITPVWRWPSTVELELPGGIWIKRLIEAERAGVRSWTRPLSGQQIEYLSAAESWLVFDYSYDPGKDSATKSQEALDKTMNTAMAIQVCRPVGSHDTGWPLMQYEANGQSYDLQSVSHHSPLHPTRWARMDSYKGLTRTELLAVVEGVHQTFEQGIIRMQNPLHFLEHGLQATNMHLRLFLWVTGLDALLMAGNTYNFERRLCNFLGADSLIFPSIDSFGQPKYRVDKFAADLYELRSEVAHGKRIPEKFRKPFEFQYDYNSEIESFEAQYQYRQFLEEAALFLLCAAMRKVFTQKLLDEVAKEKTWRMRLEEP